MVPPVPRSEPIARLIGELGRLPGVGERSATRLAFHIIRTSCGQRDAGAPSLALDLAAALQAVVAEVGLCQRCQNLCAGRLCGICADPRRDVGVICVVEGVADLRAIEGCGAHRGVYHVLHGALAPLDGIGPEEIKFAELMARMQRGDVREVILATNADVEGDATALFLARSLRPFGAQLTRPAAGIPLGGEMEFLDQGTLNRALGERRPF